MGSDESSRGVGLTYTKQLVPAELEFPSIWEVDFGPVDWLFLYLLILGDSKSSWLSAHLQICNLTGKLATSILSVSTAILVSKIVEVDLVSYSDITLSVPGRVREIMNNTWL